MCPERSGLTHELIKATQNWLLCKYKPSNLPPREMEPYFSLALSVSQGDSPVNSIDDVGFWAKLVGPLHQTVTSAVVTLKIDDGTAANHPEIPIFSLTRSGDGASPAIPSSPGDTILPDGLSVMPFSSAGPTQNWTATISYKYSDAVNDHLASTAIQSAKQILKIYPVIGGFASTIIDQENKADRNKMDQYISGLFSHPGQSPSLSLSLSANDYAQLDHVEAVMYDADLNSAKKKVVAYVMLTPRFISSLFTDKHDASGKPEYGGVGYAGRRIPELGNQSVIAIYAAKHGDLESGLANGQVDTFKQVCLNGLQQFTDLGLEPDTDAVYATWLVLTGSPAADKKVESDAMCPSIVLKTMAELGLAPFGFQGASGDTDPKQRQQNILASNSKTDAVATAVALQDANLAQYFAPRVIVTQTTNALNGIPIGSPVYVDASPLADAIKAKGTGNLSNYKHTNLASPVVQATLAIGERHYSVKIRWSGISDSDVITSMDIDDMAG